MVFDEQKYSKKYREENKEYFTKYRKEYYLRNTEKIIKKNKKYYQKNKEKKVKQGKEYYQKNREKIKIRREKYYDKYPEKRPEESKKYYNKSKEKILSYNKEYRRKNKKKLLNYQRNYYNLNKNKVNKRARKWEKKRHKTNKNFNLRIRLRHYIKLVLDKYVQEGKITKSKDYGINYQAIINYLKPFPEDLSLYHIHHIDEDGSTNLEEIKKAFAPENHKLLLIEEHRKLNHRKLANGS